MSLIFLRHTPTSVGNLVCYGDQDVSLAITGPADIATAVSLLPEFDDVVSSPLSRCVQLAEAASRSIEQPYRCDDRLKEMHFGAWQGLAWDDVPRVELDEWAGDFELARPHGGENIAMLRARVTECLLDLKAMNKLDHRLLIVTHAGVIRTALSLLEFGEQIDERERTIDYGSWRQVPMSALEKIEAN